MYICIDRYVVYYLDGLVLWATGKPSSLNPNAPSGPWFLALKGSRFNVYGNGLG